MGGTTIEYANNKTIVHVGANVYLWDKDSQGQFYNYLPGLYEGQATLEFCDGSTTIDCASPITMPLHIYVLINQVASSQQNKRIME